MRSFISYKKQIGVWLLIISVLFGNVPVYATALSNDNSDIPTDSGPEQESAEESLPEEDFEESLPEDPSSEAQPTQEQTLPEEEAKEQPSEEQADLAKDLPEDEEAIAALAAPGDSVTVDPNITHGTVAVNSAENGMITGTAIPEAGYDLATVRYIYTQNGKQIEGYAKINEVGTQSYAYEFPALATAVRITATFFSTTVWDGAVDISWYNPVESSYQIGTPAQLAGLSAIVNGMVDDAITKPDMIKGDAPKYIQTIPVEGELTSVQGGDVNDLTYRLPAVVKERPEAADDNRHDMKYKTIYLTADINMGTLNYAPIGGKYSMDTTMIAGDSKVVDTRFQGMLEGQGHTVTLTCDRYSPKGYAYSMAIGFIGYLGGNLDGGAKDSQIDYARAGYMPTVRNVIINGSIRGRRMVGGVVGRVGQTNYGVLIENCANHAAITGTDKRGIAGIVGAGYGNGTIRNCYNTGAITSVFEEVGGICGSNGYSKQGLDIYNCYNAGTILVDNQYEGREIGTDAGNFGIYTVENCYYSQPATGVSAAEEGYCQFGNSSAYVAVTRCTTAQMQSGLAEKLNTNGAAFVEDEMQTNSGLPILFFEAADYTGKGACGVGVIAAEHGNVSATPGGSIYPYGTTISFSSTAEPGYIMRRYMVNGAAVPHDYYTLTQDIEVSADFEEVGAVAIHCNPSDRYTVTLTKTWDNSRQQQVQEVIADGDMLSEGDVFTVTAAINPTAMPDDVNLEYTGLFDAPQVRDKATAAVNPSNLQKFTVTGAGDIELVISPKTIGKKWITIADKSWYTKAAREYVLTTPQQLAGMAAILYEKLDTFQGKTIYLGNNIDMTNIDGTTGKRNWSIAGGVNTSQRFKGTFDGRGYTISNLYRDFNEKICSGSYGGLFAYADGAVIQNVTVTGNFVNATQSSGGIAATAQHTTIRNCVNKINMNMARECGGILSQASDGTVVERCQNYGTITGSLGLGGIVSQIDSFSSTTNIRIADCTNYGKIVSSAYKAGGIAAESNCTANIQQCVNQGDISALQPSAATLAQAVGGIVGYISGPTKVEACYNTGVVRGENCVGAVGGIIGYISSFKTASVINCYNTGSVHSDGLISSNACVGGIVNTNPSASYKPVIANCYNAGRITIGPGFKTVNYGGCFGLGNVANYTNNYCLDQAVNQIQNKVGISGKLLSAETLKRSASTLGSAYCNDEVPLINQGYPILRFSAAEKPPSGVKLNKSMLEFREKRTEKLTATVSPADTKQTQVMWKSSNNQVAKVDANGVVTAVNDGVCTITVTTKQGGHFASCKVYVGLVDTPTFISATARKCNSALLKWKAVSGVSGYEIYRQENGTYKLLKTLPQSSTSYTNSGLTCGNTYSYKIKAYKIIQDRKIYGKEAGISCKILPGTPKLAAVKKSGSKKVKVTWKKADGVSGYTIYRATKKKGSYKAVKTITKSTQLSWSDAAVKKGKTYYYKVRAYKKVEKRKVYGAYSGVKYVKIRL